jgi:single-strand DNA-binding protein
MINKAILVGRLGRDPEVRYTPDGIMVVTLNVATDEQWKDKDGKKVQKTEWHKVVAFKKLAEICGKYLAKGQMVYLEGKIQTRSWDDKDGGKRYSTEIIASNMQMLGGPKTSQETSQGTSQEAFPEPPHQMSPEQPNYDDDVPF